jgi:hypothetical protein
MPNCVQSFFSPDTGFGADDGATLLMAFRGLQAETAQQGGAHQAIARELQQLVADPFEKWAITYHVRHNDSHAHTHTHTAFRRRGSRPAGLPSLMATSRTMRGLKLRYA